MKSPNNLEQKLDIIKTLIHLMFKYPDERICQLIYNALTISGYLDESDDIFFIKDKALLDSLNKRGEE